MEHSSGILETCDSLLGGRLRDWTSLHHRLPDRQRCWSTQHLRKRRDQLREFRHWYSVLRSTGVLLASSDPWKADAGHESYRHEWRSNLLSQSRWQVSGHDRFFHHPLHRISDVHLDKEEAVPPRHDGGMLNLQEIIINEN